MKNNKFIILIITIIVALIFINLYSNIRYKFLLSDKEYEYNIDIHNKDELESLKNIIE